MRLDGVMVASWYLVHGRLMSVVGCCMLFVVVSCCLFAVVGVCLLLVVVCSLFSVV